MTLFDAVFLGVIEGLTEFLPVSSTGHLILAAALLGLEQTVFVKTFEIAIQLGAICAVIATYFKRFFEFELLKRLFIAFLPTGVIGLALYSFIKTHLVGNEVVVVWSLLIGGIALIAFEYFHRPAEPTGGTQSITYGQALFIGLMQSVAMIPGVSRSAATIVGGLLAGLSRTTIVEFSFLLAVPTMLAATGYDLLRSASLFANAEWGMLAAGFGSAFLVALVAIRFLIAFVSRYSFTPFGVYRILIAAIFMMAFL